jgi:hypothetical protein
MRWTVRLEARTDQGEVETTELVTFNRLVVDGSLAELGLALSEAKVVGDTAAADASRPIVMLDGAYVRAVPGH